MPLRAFIPAVFVIWSLCPQAAVAEVVECPGLLPTPEATPQHTDVAAKALLGSFVGALDLRGRRAFDEAELASRYAHNPGELLSKLQDLDLECLELLRNDQLSVDERRQTMRRRFLEVVLTTSDGSDAEAQQAIQDIEGEISLSVKKLSRELWFQETKEPLDDTNRWAVIVASPTAARAWEELREHQERWPQMHFQLHVPYDEGNPYYAIVVGRRLSKTNAEKLVAIVQQAGLASDSYKWPLPVDKSKEDLLAGSFIER